jgi:hypothetical protein
LLLWWNQESRSNIIYNSACKKWSIHRILLKNNSMAEQRTNIFHKEEQTPGMLSRMCLSSSSLGSIQIKFLTILPRKVVPSWSPPLMLLPL